MSYADQIFIDIFFVGIFYLYLVQRIEVFSTQEISYNAYMLDDYSDRKSVV